MDRRASIVSVLLIVGLSFGCRSALAPNVSRNRAPETWITAAPQDTITVHTSDGGRDPATIHTIPIRFHMYWAGSDIDGAVSGFYWAVVETLPLPPEGARDVAPLPGPRPSSYRFTARTDTTFSFDVSEFRPDRQHAFFIYAVDDKGKPDPTPARFIFNALDRFPPVPIFDVAAGTGVVARVLSHGVVTYKDTTISFSDSLDLRPGHFGRPPSDTLPSGARIDFRWHAEPRIAGGFATRFKYKLDEPLFVEVDSSTHTASYNAGLGTETSRPGTKLFTLLAIDAAGGTSSVNNTRRFHINRRPDTWFAGPDSNLVPVVPGSGGQRYLTITDWRHLPPLPGSMLSCDSLHLWPSERKQRKTFWEIYENRLYLHAENDTVNMNGFLVISTGGADTDSPYNVLVGANDEILKRDTVECGSELARVVRPSGPTGSPIGFRIQYANFLDLDFANVALPSQTGLYPLFDPASSSRLPTINGYTVLNQSGRAYLIVRAQDGDGASDDRFSTARAAAILADDVDAGRDLNPDDVALRSRVLTFHVNRSPYFQFDDPGFVPKPPCLSCSPPVDTASSSSRDLVLHLPAFDPDPYDLATRPAGGGGRSGATILRTQVTVIGSYTEGGVTRDTSFAAPRSFDINQTIRLPIDAPYITGTVLTLDIELCDCADCEGSPGTGRCIHHRIPMKVPPVTAASTGPPRDPSTTTTGMSLRNAVRSSHP